MGKAKTIRFCHACFKQGVTLKFKFQSVRLSTNYVPSTIYIKLCFSAVVTPMFVTASINLIVSVPVSELCPALFPENADLKHKIEGREG